MGLVPALVTRIIACRVLTAAGASFRPPSLVYDELLSSQTQGGGTATSIFEEALTEVGMIAVTGIPSFEELRRKVLLGAYDCARAMPSARVHTFEDGTVRRTLAMVTNSSGEHVLEQADSAPGCARFTKELSEFRSLVGQVSGAFARFLRGILDLDGDAPLLAVQGDGPRTYGTVEDLFTYGEQLEHVHSYYAPPPRHGTVDVPTMEFHTDHGMCIAFTQALFIEEGASGAMPSEDQTGGKFEIQLRNGDRVEVRLLGDELVFMLGDGVNRFINTRKVSGPQLRAVPHSLTMRAHDANKWRLWYGRMFLPPQDAVIDSHGTTQSELRQHLAEAWVASDLDEDDDAEFSRRDWLSLGCSGPPQFRVAELRELNSDPPCASGSRRRCSGSCADNQLHCWWRCMNFTEEVSPVGCAAKGSGFNCTNRRDEVSIGGVHHGDYDITCTNSTKPVQPNCALPQINVDRPGSCTSSGFEAFIAAQGSYEGRHDLVKRAGADETEVAFLWNVQGGEVEGMLAFDGKVAWIAWGMENIGGKHNGMNGAHVLLGVVPDDQEFPELSGTVGEYKIHDDQSRFRMWNTPYATPASAETEIISETCFSAMKFKTASVYGHPLNVTPGSQNRLIWAARSSSYMHIGKDSYHEGCAGETRTRNRGGGAENPWVVDFHNYTERGGRSTGTSTKLLDADISRAGKVAMFSFGGVAAHLLASSCALLLA